MHLVRGVYMQKKWFLTLLLLCGAFMGSGKRAACDFHWEMQSEREYVNNIISNKWRVDSNFY